MRVVTWIGDHLVLLSAIALAVLVAIGLTLLVVRALGLLRTVKSSTSTVDPHVATLSQSIGQAEARVGGLAEGQEELVGTIDRVRIQAEELGRLVTAASAAMKVLRAPLKYFGR